MVVAERELINDAAPGHPVGRGHWTNDAGKGASLNFSAIVVANSDGRAGAGYRTQVLTPIERDSRCEPPKGGLFLLYAH